MTRAERAAELHAKGYNCAQSVACAFSDKVDMQEEDLFKVMEGFGLGMGGMMGTCGAVTGAVCILSLQNSVGTSDTTNKKKTYGVVKEVSERFKKNNGSTICEELKGVKTGKVLQSCPNCIKDACDILAEMIGD